MRDIKIASRYAKSLLKISIEANALEELHNDMQLVNSTCLQSSDLTSMLKSPIVRTDKKLNILNEVFGKSVSNIAITFINLITTKKREGILGDIAASFLEAYKTHKNIGTATATTAIALSDEQKAIIVNLLTKEGYNNIELNEVVNPEIIGGMILRVGDKQVDESIKRKLTNLEMEFDENPYVREY